MPRAWRRVVLATLVLGVALPVSALAKGPEIFPLAKVKQGQKGYGETVFQGTKPERFEFEVVGVVKNFLPKQDIILVRSDDPKIKKYGFARGMSGSPLYIDGKVACAFAYGWGFTRGGNIGGCTPIEYMIAEAKRPVRGPDAAALASRSEWRRHKPLAALFERKDQATARDRWLLGAPLPSVPPQPAGHEEGLARAGLPLAISGLGSDAFQKARQIFAPYGIEVTQGGGGSSGSSDGPSRYEMGGPIGAMLARGDVSMVATGTVSYVNDTKVLAFGHPFFQFGEVYMPAVTAEVHMVVPSLLMSFKLASPMREIGSLVQDRQSAIVVDTKTETPMIPVVLRLKGPDGTHVFNSEVLANRLLTPPLVGLMASNAARLYAPDVDDATVKVESKLFLKGHRPLVFTDYEYSPDGPGGAIASARALRILAPLLFNPFEPITIERVEVDVDIAYKIDYADIEAVRAPGVELPVGKTFLEVQLRPFNAAPYVERIPIHVPERLAGSTIKVEVASGSQARLDIAPPQNMAQLLELLRLSYPSNTLVATIYTPDNGVKLGGRLIPNLPDSAFDTVIPAASTEKGQAFKSTIRTVVPHRRVVQGRYELVLKIADE